MFTTEIKVQTSNQSFNIRSTASAILFDAFDNERLHRTGERLNHRRVKTRNPSHGNNFDRFLSNSVQQLPWRTYSTERSGHRCWHSTVRSKLWSGSHIW